MYKIKWLIFLGLEDNHLNYVIGYIQYITEIRNVLTDLSVDLTVSKHKLV